MTWKNASLDRRQFLAAAAALGVTSLTGFEALSTQLGGLPTSKISNDRVRLRAGSFKFQSHLRSVEFSESKTMLDKRVFDWNLETGRTVVIDSSVDAHVIETHPTELSLSALISKRSDRIALVDWKSEKEVAHFMFKDPEYAYGHGQFTSDGRFLLVSSLNAKSRAGSIWKFEIPSLRLVEVCTLPSGSVHDMVSLSDDRYLLAVSDGFKRTTSFVVFNLHTQKFTYFPTEFKSPDTFLFMGHLKHCGDKCLANVNAVRKGVLEEGGLVSFDVDRQQVKTLSPLSANGFTSEILSIEFDHSTGYAWFTMPEQKAVIVWDMKSNRLVKALQLELSPLSVSILPKLEMVIAGAGVRFFVYPSKTMQRLDQVETRLPHQLLNGGRTSHSRFA